MTKATNYDANGSPVEDDLILMDQEDCIQETEAQVSVLKDYLIIMASWAQSLESHIPVEEQPTFKKDLAAVTKILQSFKN